MTQTLGSDELALRPARFNERFIAYVLDVLPFAAGYSAAVYWLSARVPEAQSRLFAPAAIALYVLYQLFGNLAGGTIGKRLMGLRVVRRDGSPLGFLRSGARALGSVLSTPLFNFGYLIALAHPEQRALHDLLSGSVVVERGRSPAEAFILFVAAVLTMCALYGGMLYLHVGRPTPSDRLAVDKARDGLLVMAQIEEAYKTANGSYTQNLSELAKASGDAEMFRRAMADIFDPHLFRIEAGNKGYRIAAVARDRRKTQVAVQGPPAALLGSGAQ